MTKPPTQQPTQQPTQAERRKARQAAALRDNLKRRKAKERDQPQTAIAAEEPKPS